MDELSYFHQATVLICGTLDLDNAMKRCFTFLKQYIPLEMIELSIFDEDSQTINILTRHSDFEFPTKTVNQIPLSNETAAYIKGKEFRRKLIFFNSSQDAILPVKYISQFLGFDQVVGMVLPLIVDQQDLGSFVVLTRGTQNFDVMHGRLVSLLHDPIAMAMSNHLRYREVVRLKDMLFDDNQYLHSELHKMTGDEIVGKDYGLQGVMEMVRQVAPMESRVMLLGETGVGKEVIANAMHYFSPRRNGPLIKVNCGAIPEGLLDSELFGHEKGAFTGAVSMKRGRFERAHKGTIFLDEIGELPPAAQVRLLRVIQEGCIERVGGTKPIPIDVRIIAATHRNLENMVRRGAFREDLWYRLNVFPITIPPLRHRKSDIPAFVEYFIRKKVSTLNLRHSPRVSSRAIQRLQQYDWPGNVRELDNVVERELITHQAMGADHRLEFMEFDRQRSSPQPIEQQDKTVAPSMAHPDRPNRVAEFIFDGPFREDKAEKEKAADEASLDSMNLDHLIAGHIRKVIRLTRGKIQGEDGAAALLGLHPSTLRHRMRKLDIPFGRKAAIGHRKR